jgi:hypothetical protein
LDEPFKREYGPTPPPSERSLNIKKSESDSPNYDRKHDKPIERTTCIGTIELSNGLWYRGCKVIYQITAGPLIYQLLPSGLGWSQLTYDP